MKTVTSSLKLENGEKLIRLFIKLDNLYTIQNLLSNKFWRLIWCGVAGQRSALSPLMMLVTETRCRL